MAPWLLLLVSLVSALVIPPALARSRAGGYTVVGWNNLGMHCMDADYNVFSILPPYNTIHAQLIDGSGNLVKDPAGITVTYRGVVDTAGSINTTSSGKTSFWDRVLQLFGVSVPVDMGLAGKAMPGPQNTPQPMTFDAAKGWFIAEGIPITPYDDAVHKNPYPMMRLEAKDANGNILASTDIVLPVSDEMTCTACHASGSGDAAKPSAGWVNDLNPERDYRLNILRLHDERLAGNFTFEAALAARGYNAAGLYATVTADNRAILCASCHPSEALPGTGYAGVPPLTQSMHGYHAYVVDPTNGQPLDSSANRSACYRCHPGAVTRCLRGVMGSAVAPDGSLAIQCQSCHGSMSAVGASTRTGWLMEPNCQSCHTGSAIKNNGQIRYTTAFETNGQPRVAVSNLFATDPDTPAAGLSLYRFSTGHGGLTCEACHGSTHAEYPSRFPNDNVQSLNIQGHVGMLAECGKCHNTTPNTVDGGPHGLHPTGQVWVDGHPDQLEHYDKGRCRICHGADYTGTILSRSTADRTLSTKWGTKRFWRGFQIGCYTCHSGPDSENGNSNSPAVASNGSAATTAGTPVSIPLHATDANGNPLKLRVVSQPAHGTAGLSGTLATYIPDSGFTGSDSFTFSAWDGATDSNLATISLTVTGSACAVTCSATVPAAAATGTAVPFQAAATATGCAGSVSFSWTFGDGATSSEQNPSHIYGAAGTYPWTLTASTTEATCTKSGSIFIGSDPCMVICNATASPASGTPPLSVAFAGTATLLNCDGTPSYLWSFGDGLTAATANAAHIFAAAGDYTWSFTVTYGGQTCSKTGVISVACDSPTVTAVTKLTDPFRLKVDASGLKTGYKVYLAGQSTAWANVRVKSASQFILKGCGSLFPNDGSWVDIRIENPSGCSVTVQYNKKSKAWRPKP